MKKQVCECGSHFESLRTMFPGSDHWLRASFHDCDETQLASNNPLQGAGKAKGHCCNWFPCPHLHAAALSETDCLGRQKCSDRGFDLKLEAMPKPTLFNVGSDFPPTASTSLKCSSSAGSWTIFSCGRRPVTWLLYFPF